MRSERNAVKESVPCSGKHTFCMTRRCTHDAFNRSRRSQNIMPDFVTSPRRGQRLILAPLHDHIEEFEQHILDALAVGRHAGQHLDMRRKAQRQA
jgi:hypothetical protein